MNIKHLNTFGLSVLADHYLQFSNINDLKHIFDIIEDDKYMILGGGSNILFTKNYDGWILHNCILCKEILSENETHVTVKIGAGEIWHNTVLWALDQNYGGMENLSLIPGYVGAAPMQNIGAYGVEVKDIITQVETYHIESKQLINFSNEECQFGYRESIFKQKENQGKYVITAVTLQLTKKNHSLHLQYGAIKETLEKSGIKAPTIKDISDAVVSIRKSKLPDPKLLGNAGSFFKNPIISQNKYNELIQHYPAIPAYPQPDNSVKIPAGWLIEQCGFKGKIYGQTGSHKDQALVIVNYGDATGSEIIEHAERVIAEVNKIFGIELKPEVNIV